MRLEHRRIEQREPHSLVALPAVRKYPSGRRVHIVIFSMPLVLNQVRRGFRYGVPWTKHRSGLDGERDARNSGGVVTVFAYLGGSLSLDRDRLADLDHHQVVAHLQSS